MTRRHALMVGSALFGLSLSGILRVSAAAPAVRFPVIHTDAEWQRLLTPAQFAILRRAGTEQPGSSPLDHEFRPGIYACVGCRQPVFDGDAKFDSHTGWPSFWQPTAGAVATSQDNSAFVARTEVHCSNCGGHLGHVFDDGPKPTGLRYCMNGAVLRFQPA